jgi:hypothetical protein
VIYLDENLFAKLIDDIDASDGWTEEDKDLMRRLAKKAAEIDSEAEN